MTLIQTSINYVPVNAVVLGSLLFGMYELNLIPVGLELLVLPVISTIAAFGSYLISRYLQGYKSSLKLKNYVIGTGLASATILAGYLLSVVLGYPSGMMHLLIITAVASLSSLLNVLIMNM